MIDESETENGENFTPENELKKEIDKWKAANFIPRSTTSTYNLIYNKQAISPSQQSTTVNMLVLGDEGVGKTNFIKMMTGHYYSRDYKKSSSNSPREHQFKVENSELAQPLKLNITEGYYDFTNNAFNQAIVHSAQVVFFVFDVNDIKSLNNIFQDFNGWWSQVEYDLSQNHRCILVGTQTDKEDQRVVTFERAQEHAKEHGLEYIEISAANYTVDTALSSDSSNSPSQQDIATFFGNKDTLRASDDQTVNHHTHLISTNQRQ